MKLLISVLLVVLSSSVLGDAVQHARTTPGIYGPPVIVGTIQNSELTESSGLVASRQSMGLYWTHNDSGDGPFIYCLDGKGRPCGTWRVTNAAAVDWEDIATGPGPIAGKSYLYVGDIGDNNHKRSEVVVYRVAEPVVPKNSTNSKRKGANATEPAEAFRLSYPDGKHDAECLLVHPVTGDVYIVVKVPFENPGVYEAKAPLKSNEITTMTRIAELKIPSIFRGVITGGSISPDGKRIALCDYFQGYELVLPETSQSFSEIWSQRIVGFDLGKRKQGESITYRADGQALLATSEDYPSPLIMVLRK